MAGGPFCASPQSIRNRRAARVCDSKTILVQQLNRVVALGQTGKVMASGHSVCSYRFS